VAEEQEQSVWGERLWQPRAGPLKLSQAIQEVSWEEVLAELSCKGQV
jgi:hypothetical protein